jgi:hypothetical protein
MNIPESLQERIDQLVATIQAGETIEFSQLCDLLFAIIEAFCATLPPAQGAGRHKTYSDSTILKIDMLMHLTGKRGETEILREIQRHYRQYFAQVPGQSRLWHRIHAALPLIERFRQAVRAQLGVEYEDLRVLDSMPLPVATLTTRPGCGNGFDLADWGYCASKKLIYRGFKLGLLITDHGIPDVYDLFSARPHDLQLLPDLLGDQEQIIALGDKGFLSARKQAQLREEQEVILLTYRRQNQKQRNTPLEQWTLQHYRTLIETVLSQLDGHMHIQDAGAKTDIGLVKRVIGIITAFTVGIYLNFLLGRPLLEIKALFA